MKANGDLKLLNIWTILLISEIGPRELDGHDDVCVSVRRPNIPLLSRYLEAADLRS